MENAVSGRKKIASWIHLPFPPSDPDATYKNKFGKSYRGYAANIEEIVEKTVL